MTPEPVFPKFFNPQPKEKRRILPELTPDPPLLVSHPSRHYFFYFFCLLYVCTEVGNRYFINIVATVIC